jgi:uncharacterized membrane protein YhaH (DUF805 family)
MKFEVKIILREWLLNIGVLMLFFIFAWSVLHKAEWWQLPDDYFLLSILVLIITVVAQFFLDRSIKNHCKETDAKDWQPDSFMHLLALTGEHLINPKTKIERDLFLIINIIMYAGLAFNLVYIGNLFFDSNSDNGKIMVAALTPITIILILIFRYIKTKRVL